MISETATSPLIFVERYEKRHTHRVNFEKLFGSGLLRLAAAVFLGEEWVGAEVGSVLIVAVVRRGCGKLCFNDALHIKHVKQATN